MENKREIYKAIEKLKKQTSEIEKLYNEYQGLYNNGFKEKANAVAYELIYKLEKYAVDVRALPILSGEKEAEEKVNNIIQDVYKVEIRYTEEGWFNMKLPALLPKKEKGNNDFLRGIIYPALSRFFENNTAKKINPCVIIYRHVFSKDRPERHYIDHDNYEKNFITDSIATFVMVDDGPVNCDHFYCSSIEDEEYTDIYVVPSAEFNEWRIKNLDKII